MGFLGSFAFYCDSQRHLGQWERVVYVCLCLSADVVQTPGLVVSRPGANVSLLCEHKDSGFLYKFWYRQEKHRPLTFIGSVHTTQRPNMDREFDGRIKIQPQSAQSAQLIISNVSPSDAAIYYCTSSPHSDTGRGRLCAELTDTPPPSLHNCLTPPYVQMM
ncbi:hypothetical protein XELAEV_18034191mg [Xenopus laevis]|uniref:Ig-like domain-containing protein n=1 Tax=Xenopus laevis TaxID=8355 RepID=A0A974CDH5_XENLA|nr:hypothetical protein XELAEV_18034191mg [Xenopus laevis]